MNKIINDIVALQNQYPKLISTFPHADSRMIKFVEEFLSVKLDEQLLEIYEFSNGLSFLHYGLAGIYNKFMINLLDLNQGIPDDMDIYNGYRHVAFMSDEGGGYYSYLDNPQEMTHAVYFKNNESFKHELLAPSIKDFFNFFLERIPLVLENHLKDGEYLFIHEEAIFPSNL